MKQCPRFDMLGGLTMSSEEAGMKRTAAGSECKRSTIRRISECLIDMGLSADEILANIGGDFGNKADKKFCAAALFEEDDFDIPFDRNLDCSIEFSFSAPRVFDDDVWSPTAESMWTPEIDTETENQILQLLSENDVLATSPSQLSMSPISWAIESRLNNSSDLKPTADSTKNIGAIQSQTSEDGSYTSSGLGSSASSSYGGSVGEDSGLDDEEDWNYQSFPELDDDFCDEMLNNVLVIKPENTEIDDESEDVDIMSIVEEVESVALATPTAPPTMCSKAAIHVKLDAEQLKRLHTVRRVSSDHCYCPQVAAQWIDSAENPHRQTTATVTNTIKQKSRSNNTCRHQQRGNGITKKSAQLKRAGAKNGMLLSGSGRSASGLMHKSSRHFAHNTREKREQLNQMERERRIGLKSCFEKLRLAVPEISANSKASKDKILLLARTFIYSLSQRNFELMKEKVAMQKEQEYWNRRLKAVRN